MPDFNDREALSQLCGKQIILCSKFAIPDLMAFFRGRNKALSSDMTELICHLIGHKFSQFQALSGLFVKKKLKII